MQSNPLILDVVFITLSNSLITIQIQFDISAIASNEILKCDVSINHKGALYNIETETGTQT